MYINLDTGYFCADQNRISQKFRHGLQQKFMSNFNDLINLAKADGGKFFVIDEEGNAKLVIMSIEDYQRILLGKLQRQVEDIEQVNSMILKAQLQETPPVPPAPAPKFSGPQVISNGSPPRVDLREEVIDPNFDFEAPKVDIDDL